MMGITAYLFQIRKLRNREIKWSSKPTQQINSRGDLHTRFFGFKGAVLLGTLSSLVSLVGLKPHDLVLSLNTTVIETDRFYA